jgi:SWIM zinc finger
MVEELVFLVKGSSSDTYEVTFIKDGASLTALCTCPAGQFGNFCKHRIAILDGDFDSISSDNADRASMVTEWLKGTDVQAALGALRKAEETTGCSKKELAALKKKLARAMNS